ncbi:MAG: M28 family metallopeptidase [Phycisphaerae bacterium]
MTRALGAIMVIGTVGSFLLSSKAVAESQRRNSAPPSDALRANAQIETQARPSDDTDPPTAPTGGNPADFLVNQLSMPQFYQNMVDLSTIPAFPGASTFSRFWQILGNITAENYLKDKLMSYGYTNVVLDSYTMGNQTKHNIYATKVGTVNPDQMYIVSAHMDSVNFSAILDAPGFDDDGSGSSLVLELARVFAKARVDTSIRFVLWNNEETGLNGSAAYVANHRNLQGTPDEPTWLGVIQHDMILFDHLSDPPDADVEYQALHDFGGAAIDLANAVAGAMAVYGSMPAEVSDNMDFTDSKSFQDDVASISVRENRRVLEIGQGSNPNWHEASDNRETYNLVDIQFGFNIVKMTAGAVAELVGAEPDCNQNNITDAQDIMAGAPDTNADGIPDECQDCNANGQLDPLEIASGTAPDCNGNGVPDACDISAAVAADCDGNAVPDSCQLAGNDCNFNGQLDSCDVALGFLVDSNGDGQADQCGVAPVGENFLAANCTTDADCANTSVCVPPPSGQGGSGTCYVPKNRYVSLGPSPANAGIQTARRVSVDLNGNGVFDLGTDPVLGWIAEPIAVVVAGPEPSPQLLSRIAAMPFYMDWSVAGGAGDVVHLGDCHVSSGHTYFIHNIALGLDIGNETNYSDALALPTVGTWGDVAGGGSPALPADGVANLGDALAVVLGFQDQQSAPKVWLDLDGLGNPDNAPDFGTINIADIQRAVQGFQEASYPFSDPCSCNGAAPCP